jgi:hypothetical protein
MADLKPLSHPDVERKDDATLRREAEAHFARVPGLQVIAELLVKLRARSFSWWSPDDLRVSWNATERMRWLRERPDLREQITSTLTGLPPSAARKKTPEFQGSLLDSFLEDGDITVRQFEDAFDPCDLVVYGSASTFFRKFRERMPWDDETPAHQELIGFLLRALLADKSSLRGVTRKPILTAWDVRTAIPGAVWHARIPLDVRVAIDDARLAKEKSGQSFAIAQELTIATPEVIAASVPARELTTLLDLAQAALGCEAATPSVTTMASSTPTPPAPDPALRQAEDMLASISRRAVVAPAPKAASTPPPAIATPRASIAPAVRTPAARAHATPGHAANGYIALSTPDSRRPATARARSAWPDDDDDDDELDIVVDRHRDEEKTQPRAQALAR